MNNSFSDVSTPGARFSSKTSGFTLVELLVVMAVIAMLAALRIPALAKAKQRTQEISCANNLKQLSLGFCMYAGDNNENLPGSQLWASGNMDALPGATNLVALRNTLIYPYVQNTAVYRCPADKSTITASGIIFPYGGPGMPRIRSVSANAWINGPSAALLAESPGYTLYMKSTQIIHPAQIFFLVDENPGAINDGFFLNKPGISFWVDLPATYHSNAGGMGFADGHAITKLYHDPAILGPLIINYYATPPGDGGVDLRWMFSVCSELR